MNLAEYSEFDGLGLAALVQSGQVSVVELAETAISAIDALNPSVNAVIEVYRDQAKKAAMAPSQGAFAGVPFLLKDIGAHDAGVINELGSRLTAGLRAPSFASELVTRFRSTGLTILGRTNVPELGSSCSTEPLLHGATRNPWNLDMSPGGSSGGAAAAVASGMVPIAHANDAGGSIRWPAACCGLVGLKPSRNLNPVGPDMALPVSGFAAEHIVSKTVRDTAAMLDATAGPESGAWCYTPRFDGSYLEALDAPSDRLRIGFSLNAKFPPTTLHPEVVAGTHAAANLCESLGHYVTEADLQFDYETLLDAFRIIWMVNLRGSVEMLSAITGRAPSDKTLEPHVLAAYRDSEQVPASKFARALDHMNIASRAYGAYFDRFDVLLTPAGAQPPFPIGKIPMLPSETFEEFFMAMCAHCPFLSTVNIAGVTGLSLPIHWSADGLPVGSHFVARQGGELTLLKLAAELEIAQPWNSRIAGVHASRL